MKHQIKPITEQGKTERERGTQLEFVFERLHNNVATNDRQIKPNQNYFNSQTTMHIFLGDFCKSRIRWFLPNKFHWENSFIKHSTNFGLVLNPSHKVGRDCVCVCVRQLYAVTVLLYSGQAVAWLGMHIECHVMPCTSSSLSLALSLSLSAYIYSPYT